MPDWAPLSVEATRIWYAAWTCSPAPPVSCHPKRGARASMPSGVGRCSVVGAATVSGEAAPRSGAATPVPQGAAPYVPETAAAGQAPSANPGSIQPGVTVLAAFHAPSVTRSTVPPAVVTLSLAITPAGPAVVLRAAKAIVLAPARTADARST